MTPPNELRIFISSTFRDLQEEREHLVRKVFPEIRAICRRRGVTFTDVDLRWGLTDEEGVLGRIIRTCLEEVDRCRPFFIGMIGNRYGWVPELHDILIDPDLVAAYPFVEELALDGASVTEMEFVHGVFERPQETDDGEARFYRRTGPHPEEADDPERLAALVARIAEGGYGLHDFASVEELGGLVRRDLIATIDRFWPESEAPTPLDIERSAHAAFVASRTRAYIPVAENVRTFDRWIAESTTPLLVSGASGLGKSALVASLSDRIRRKKSDAIIVEHYVGASDRGGSAVSVMRHLIAEFCEIFGVDEKIPDGGPALQRSFATWLFRAERLAAEQNRQLLLIVDAVNQLDEVGRRVGWIPKEVPEGIRLLISTTPGESLDRLREREWQELEVVPIEDERVRRSIVVRYLGEFHKAISTDLLATITADEKSSSPLFLRTLAEELRLHGEHESLDELVARYTEPESILDVFDLLLERLDGDFGGDVGSLLGLIAASRSGLTESELLDLAGIRRVDLSRILFALDDQLLRRDGRLGFFHDVLHRAVEGRYLTDEENRDRYRRSIAEYFARGRSDRRTAREVLYQYTELGDDPNVIATLCNEDLLVNIMQGPGTFDVYGAWGRLRDAGHDPVDCYRAIINEPIPEFDPEKRIDVLHRIAATFFRISLWSDALEIQQKIVDAIDVADVPDRVGDAAYMIGVIRQMRGENDEARTWLERAVEAYERAGNRSGAAAALGSIGITYHGQGEFDRALEVYHKRLSIAREVGNPIGIITALSNIGSAYIDRGDYAPAKEPLLEAIDCARASGDRIALGMAAGNYGLVCDWEGETDEALSWFNLQIAISNEVGDRHSISIALGNIGTIHNNRGEYDRALERFDEKMRVSEEVGDRRGICLSLGSKATTHFYRGELDKALDLYDRQSETAREADLPDNEAHGTANSVGVLRWLGRYDEGIDRAIRAIELARNLGNNDVLACTFEYLADILVAVLSEEIPDESPPSSLLDSLERLPLEVEGGGETAGWRERTLRYLRTILHDCRSAAEACGRRSSVVAAVNLQGWVDAAAWQQGEARQEAESMLAETTDPEEKASISYWLWRSSLFTPETDSEPLRRTALEFSRQQTERVPEDYLFAKRYREIEEAA